MVPLRSTASCRRRCAVADRRSIQVNATATPVHRASCSSAHRACVRTAPDRRYSETNVDAFDVRSGRTSNRRDNGNANLWQGSGAQTVQGVHNRQSTWLLQQAAGGSKGDCGCATPGFATDPFHNSARADSPIRKQMVQCVKTRGHHPTLIHGHNGSLQLAAKLLQNGRM